MIILFLLISIPSYAGKLDVSCIENRDLKKFLEMAKERSQERNIIEDPDRYQEDKEQCDKFIKQLDNIYDKECRGEKQ